MIRVISMLFISSYHSMFSIGWKKLFQKVYSYLFSFFSPANSVLVNLYQYFAQNCFELLYSKTTQIQNNR